MAQNRKLQKWPNLVTVKNTFKKHVKYRKTVRLKTLDPLKPPLEPSWFIVFTKTHWPPLHGQRAPGHFELLGEVGPRRQRVGTGLYRRTSFFYSFFFALICLLACLFLGELIIYMWCIHSDSNYLRLLIVKVFVVAFFQTGMFEGHLKLRKTTLSHPVEDPAFARTIRLQLQLHSKALRHQMKCSVTWKVELPNGVMTWGMLHPRASSFAQSVSCSDDWPSTSQHVGPNMSKHVKTFGEDPQNSMV